MKIMLLLLILTVLSALWSVMTRAMLRAAIALALTSVLLTIIMYRLDAPLAAVFELSVCAGLISVVFISVISLTHRLPIEEYMRRRKSRLLRFAPLPVIVVLAAVALAYVRLPLEIVPSGLAAIEDVRVVMWEVRRLDLFGQIMVLLAGVFGVIMLFRRSGSDAK